MERQTRRYHCGNSTPGLSAVGKDEKTLPGKPGQASFFDRTAIFGYTETDVGRTRVLLFWAFPYPRASVNQHHRLILTLITIDGHSSTECGNE